MQPDLVLRGIGGLALINHEAYEEQNKKTDFSRKERQARQEAPNNGHPAGATMHGTRVAGTARSINPDIQNFLASLALFASEQFLFFVRFVCFVCFVVETRGRQTMPPKAAKGSGY
ncbi:hypothetical protein [Thioalkalivibrio denitrificans]|uniref:hypothetical protein n=1 Tax=Thioalkalivibrio denitrificans TaxID=108003 RepID=UPI0011158C6E|nr:hypothetical protein [Thioalkalivibrio denitrificans]